MSIVENYLKKDFLLGEEDLVVAGDVLMSEVLFDADGLIALAKKDDSNHVRAVKIANVLQTKGVFYYLSPFTVAEAVTVLSYKVSHKSAKDLLEEVRRLGLLALELPKEKEKLADKWFLSQTKKGTSYFDCYNLALLDCYKKQLQAIFSFDSVYRKNGFKLAGELI